MCDMRPQTCLWVAGVFILLTGCGKPSANAGSSDWNAYVEHFLNAYFAAHPDFAVGMGRHEFDGQLPDFSHPALDQEIARLRAEHQRASAFSDSALDQKQRFERDYLIAVIDGELFWRDSAQWPYLNPSFYGGAVDPQVYLTRPYAPLDQRMRAFIKYARALPPVLDQIKALIYLTDRLC